MTEQQSGRHLRPSNRLISEKSAYLQSAAHQPVNWLAWGPEPFDAARRDDKPILLDIGAVWCHWCHVMDEESYEKDGTAQIINQLFIAIKVDRDERPDVDARYQAAVGAMTGQGGWPLTVFLLPDGRAFYGGTYFPPDNRYGRAGFPEVLRSVAAAFRSNHDQAILNARQVESGQNRILAAQGQPAEISDQWIRGALEEIKRDVDTEHGGFGHAPKFPHSSTLEFLLQQFDRTHEPWMIDAVRSALIAMADGGIFDQLAGGFHRYSTDEKWIVPHFEKMLYDNASLLENYVHGYQATHEARFKEVALRLISFVDEVFADSAHGGFYASQDADVSAADDGSYFTWTLAQSREILTDAELAIIRLRFHLDERGEMRHDPAQNVLFNNKSVDVISREAGIPEQEVRLILAGSMRKMRDAREKRSAPFVDRTLYSNWNGMMISAYLEAFKAFGDEHVRTFAVRSLERILGECGSSNGLIRHRPESDEAFLDDQVQIADALLHAFECTQESRYLQIAVDLVQRTVEEFGDDSAGAFFDRPRRSVPIGSLSVTHKPVQDSPTPGANAVAARVLNRLFVLTEDSRYRALAVKTLEAVAGSPHLHGRFSSSVFMAAHEYLHPPVHVVIIADDERAEDLIRIGYSTYRFGKIVSVFRRGGRAPLAASVREMLASGTGTRAYVCSEYSCTAPTNDPRLLADNVASNGGVLKAMA